MTEISGQSVLILGYGREGQSVHRYLLYYHPDKKIGIADKQNIKPKLPYTQIYTGKNYLEHIFNYNLIIRSPGIHSDLPQLKQYLKSGKKITTATNIFFALCPGIIIGITGTKGKSTTTSLTADILKEKYQDVRVVGNIGKPALDFLPKANDQTIFVVELSSFQLEDIHYSPHIVVILNIVPEHLDRYDTFFKYAQTKARIVHYQTPKDIIVFNPEHKIVSQIADSTPAKRYSYSLKPASGLTCYLDGDSIFACKQGRSPQPILDRSQIPLLGRANLENTLATIPVALAFNIPLEKIRKAILNFKTLEHRLELVGQIQGIYFYNDSLATVPEATIHALKTLGSKVETLIAGGYDRGLDFVKLGQFLNQTKVKTLILFPPTGKKIWRAISQTKSKKRHFRKYYVSSMLEAVKIAFQTTSLGKICLLSPASASFGLFRNYSERGKSFKKLVLERNN